MPEGYRADAGIHRGGEMNENTTTTEDARLFYEQADEAKAASAIVGVVVAGILIVIGMSIGFFLGWMIFGAI